MSPDDPDVHADAPSSRIHWLLVILCILALAADFFYHRHLDPAVESIEGIPGFYPIYGFVAITVLVLLSRGLRASVSRKDGYYDD